jgi:hypothetical protein
VRLLHRWWKGVGALPVALALSGCAAGEAGRSQAPASGISIEVHAYGNVTVSLKGDGNGKGTAAPESTATQDLKADGKLDVTVPVK